MQKHIKLCYILPEYNEKTADHFYHQYELLKDLSGQLDIFLVIEKSNTKNFGLAKSKIKVYIQKFKFLPLRFLENFLVVLWARILGYNKFYTHYCYIGGVNAGIISRLSGGKSYYWHCEMIWEFKQSFFSKIGFNLSLELSHILVTGSEELKNEYAKHYGLKSNNVKVMPNWINLNRFKFNNSNISSKRSDQTSSKIILFVHWLAERKGAHLLIPIAKQLLSNFQFSIPNFQLIIVGDGPLKDRIIEEIEENKLEDYIQVWGKVPNKDLMKYYAQADIFILPSLQEGFPRVLLEAMASGVPYVASDVGAVREISPKIAQDFIVERGNIEEFATKIQILLSNKDIYDKFRLEELEQVKKYSLERVAKEFTKLFE
jgi:glycosyltransferase involved in cell wall biosynthesis